MSAQKSRRLAAPRAAAAAHQLGIDRLDVRRDELLHLCGAGRAAERVSARDVGAAPVTARAARLLVCRSRALASSAAVLAADRPGLRNTRTIECDAAEPAAACAARRARSSKSAAAWVADGGRLMLRHASSQPLSLLPVHFFGAPRGGVGAAMDPARVRAASRRPPVSTRSAARLTAASPLTDCAALPDARRRRRAAGCAAPRRASCPPAPAARCRTATTTSRPRPS